MPTFTAQQIIDRAKAAADMHDTFVTPTQWMQWLTVEVAALEVMVARLGYVLKESVQTIPATGAATYTVGTTGVLAIVGVYREVNGRLRRLRTSNPVTRMRQFTSAVDVGDAREFYATANAGNDNLTIGLYPRPSSGNYFAWFIPAPATISLVSDTITYPLGWEERLVLRLAINARDKEESDTSSLVRRLNAVDQVIEEAVWSRLMAQSPCIRNSDYDDMESPDNLRWPDVSDWYFP
jgi:hypothetical protein